MDHLDENRSVISRVKYYTIVHESRIVRYGFLFTLSCRVVEHCYTLGIMAIDTTFSPVLEGVPREQIKYILTMFPYPS